MTNQRINPRGYKIAFAINGLIGIFFMALSIVGFVVQLNFPKVSGLGWDFASVACFCFIISAAMFAMYKSAQNQISKN